MNLDAFTLAALSDELLDTIVGGRVQDVLDVDETGIGLEIYANHHRHYLYLSADKTRPRVHLVPDKLRRGLPKPTTVGLLIRRYVEGGVLLHVHQPPWERVLVFDIHGPEGEAQLVIEPMERRANLLLVQNGIILDSIRRVGADENRVRVSLPQHPYVPPPPQTGKRPPDQVTTDFLRELFAQAEPKAKAPAVLTGAILGASPLVAREAVFRAHGTIDTLASQANPDVVFTAFHDLIAPLLRREWQPGIAEGERGITAFSVYPLTHLPGWHTVESVSAALVAYYQAPVGVDAYNRAKEPVRDAITEAQTKVRTRLMSLQKSLTDDREREVLRQSGELILAYQYAISKGQTELRAAYDEAGDLSIAIDPKATPLENAQRYFERYNKAKRALDDVPDLIQTAEIELAQLDQWAVDLDLASNWPEIDEVQQALQTAGYWRGTPTIKMGGGKSGPLRLVTDDGWVIWIGRNSRQNEQVTFEKGQPNDLWLHVRGVPGAHVIVKSDGRSVPDAVIEYAAGVAAHYSGRRNDVRAEVDVTERRFVRKIKGGAAGMVTYRNERTLNVAPQPAP